jgi:hypothetical protein
MDTNSDSIYLNVQTISKTGPGLLCHTALKEDMVKRFRFITKYKQVLSSTDLILPKLSRESGQKFLLLLKSLSGCGPLATN